MAEAPVICRHDIPWPRCLVCHSPPYRTIPGQEHVKNNTSKNQEHG